ncbi:MAG: hypothetical protein A4E48_02749 [Methanosaeta sp. PtaU1.Bin060]|nr:MAG: hypothetical protein A4E48_02749 [Methanosaeta sp. PtaU1.Bin060]
MKGLEARIAKLENREARYDEGTLDMLALDCLTDTELGLIQEFKSLLDAGFSREKIAGMMGEDSYHAAVDAIEKADLERKRLEA